MPYPTRQYPALAAQHVANARLYADRNDMVRELARSMQGATIAEIGVAKGDFSKILMEAFNPKSFVAFDLFNIHEWPSLWGVPPKEIFGDMTHPEHYRSLFPDKPVTLEIGKSGDNLPKYPDAHFDMIYIDGDHGYEGVKIDADLSKQKLKPDGVLIFNDYIMFDMFAELEYGVIPVVNEMIGNEGWEVTGFALNMWMFCDIAIRRKP